MKTFWILLTKLGPKIFCINSSNYSLFYVFDPNPEKIMAWEKKAFDHQNEVEKSRNKKFRIGWEVRSSEFFISGFFDLILMVKSFFFSKYEIFIFFNFSVLFMIWTKIIWKFPQKNSSNFFKISYLLKSRKKSWSLKRFHNYSDFKILA